jgi:hypothetical protein
MYWTTGILGLILTIAPFIFGYSNDSAALWTSFIVGGATIVVSLIEAARADKEQWEYWAAGILGLIAIIAPFIFGFGTNISAMWTSLVIGALIAIFAGSRLFTTGKM